MVIGTCCFLSTSSFSVDSNVIDPLPYPLPDIDIYPFPTFQSTAVGAFQLVLDVTIAEALPPRCEIVISDGCILNLYLRDCSILAVS